MPGSADGVQPVNTRTEEKPSFTVPGGYGSAPQIITPGEGAYARPPLAFSLTIQQGFNDNIYASSGRPYPAPVSSATTITTTDGPNVIHQFYPSKTGTSTPNNPVQSSPVTMASLGAQMLYSNPRAVLSLEMSGGGVYYWDRRKNGIDPSASLGLTLAYKLTPRAQLSAGISSSYLSQPDLNLVNAPTQGGVGDYLMSSGRFDLSYQWTGRISTDTTLDINSQNFLKSGTSNTSGTSSATPTAQSDFIDTTLGQTLRYSLTPILAMVGDVRYSQTTFQTGKSDSTTQFLLGGFDFQLSSRCTGSVRAGQVVRQFANTTYGTASSPFFESTLSYGYGMGSTLSWTTRYGFENGAASSSATSNKTLRTSLSLMQALSTKMAASVTVGYSNSVQSYLGTNTSLNQDTFSISLGAQYTLNRTITLFGNASRSQVLSTSVLSYSVDSVFLGATYHF